MLVLENLTLFFFFFKETRSYYVTHAALKFRFSCFQKAGIIDICHKARQAQYFQR